jgi:hypothetical protein
MPDFLSPALSSIFLPATARYESESSQPLLGSPVKKSIFKGLKLSLNNTGRKAQRFLSALTCGLVPYRGRHGNASDSMNGNNSPFAFVGRPDYPGLSSGPRMADGLEKIAVPSGLSIKEAAASLMKNNTEKRAKLDVLLAIRKKILQSTGKSYKYLEAPGRQWRPQLNDAMRNEFARLKDTSARSIWTADLSRYTAEEIFFAVHFAAGFSPLAPVRDESRPERVALCTGQMTEAYFGIFKELLELASEKKCDVSKCHDIFVEVRKDALRQALFKHDRNINGEQIGVLMRQYTEGFEARTSALPELEKNNPFFLRAAHHAAPLKPSADVTPAFAAIINQSIKHRSPSSFLLSRMACELIDHARQGDPAAPASCVTGEMAAPRTPVLEMINQREKIFEKIIAKIERATSADGDIGDGSVHVRTPKESREIKAVRKIVALFKANQAALVVRMTGHEERENGRLILSMMHYGMAPLCEEVRAEDFPDRRYLDILKQAQVLLSEHMIAFAVEKQTGKKLQQASFGEIEKLFCKSFLEEAVGALRGFMQTSPDFLEKMPLSVNEAVGEFTQAFEHALAGLPAAKDYINDRLVVALQAAGLQRGDMSGLDDRVFNSLEDAMRPSVLLARAGEKVVEELAGMASEEAEKTTEKVEGATEKVESWVTRRAVDLTVVEKIIAQLEQSRKTG